MNWRKIFEVLTSFWIDADPLKCGLMHIPLNDSVDYMRSLTHHANYVVPRRALRTKTPRGTWQSETWSVCQFKVSKNRGYPLRFFQFLVGETDSEPSDLE